MRSSPTGWRWSPQAIVSPKPPPDPSGRHQDSTIAPTDLVVGVLQNTPAAGEQAVYAFTGVAKVIAGGAIAIGDFVTTDSSGKAVATTTDGDVVIGRFVGTAAAADGDLAEIQLSIFRTFVA